MPIQSGKQGSALQIVRESEARFKAVVVGRFAMNSSLLADALNRDAECDATEVQPFDLLQLLAKDRVDIAIISADVNSKPGSGLELAGAVSSAYPSMPIVILLDESTKDATLNAFRCGARGVFSRHMAMSQFIACVKHVRQGLIWAGPEETNYFLDAIRSVPALEVLGEGDLQTLTPRELQVVRCAASGKSNRAIGSELRLSEHTIKNYLFRSFEKLGVSSRVELLFYLTMRGQTFGPAAPPQEKAPLRN